MHLLSEEISNQIFESGGNEERSDGNKITSSILLIRQKCF